MNEELWVFAYGSLIWRPGFDYLTRIRARLDGYQRSFCMESIHYRGTESEPGLVLALDPASDCNCEGILYQVPATDAQNVLAYLRERELISYAYVEGWVDCVTQDGRVIKAVTYIINRENRQYCGNLAPEAQAKIIAKSKGSAGPNWEYLETTVQHLHELGCPDADMDWLAQRVQTLRDQS